MLAEPTPPLTDRVVTDTQGSADCGVGCAVSSGQHDPGAQHVAMLTADSTSPRAQQPPLPITENNLITA
jgi:hypothetical protein